jgi:hypothetical protein
MLNHDEILEAYALAAANVEGHPQSLGSTPFILRHDYRPFIFVEVQSGSHSFHLKLAEYLPYPEGPIFQLQSRGQILASVRDAVERWNEEEAAEPPIAETIV